MGQFFDFWIDSLFGGGNKSSSKKPKKKNSGGPKKGSQEWWRRNFESDFNRARLGSQANVASKPLLPEPEPRIDPLQSLQNDLFNQMNSIQVAPTPLDELRRIAEGQVSSQFDPLIQALEQQMAAKTQRGNRSANEARQMYGDMSKDFLAQLPQMTQEFAAEDRATEARYNEAQNVLNEQYGRQAAEQDAIMRRLGIQAAQGEATQQQRDDQKYFQGQIELDQQQAMNAQDLQQNSAMDYQRSLGSNARMAGENTAQDIKRMLEEYLTEAGGQMTGLRTQKESTLNALLSQLQMQDQQRVAQQTESAQDRLMDLFRFQLDTQNSMVDNQYKMSRMNAGNEPLFKGTTGPAGASNWLAQQYPDDPDRATMLMEQINDVLMNPDVVKGKFVLKEGNPALGQSDVYADVNDQYMMKLLRNELKREGITNPQDINNTVNGLLAVLGKLR